MAGDLRAEGLLALTEAAERGSALKTELGKHTPAATKAGALVERIVQTSKLVSAASSLLEYASELDEIALNDAVVYLEQENKELQHELEHTPALADAYPALIEARGAAISEGIARAKAGANGGNGSGGENAPK
jgi:hypothetical protein